MTAFVKYEGFPVIKDAAEYEAEYEDVEDFDASTNTDLHNSMFLCELIANGYLKVEIKDNRTVYKLKVFK